ncbi:MAG: cytochrome c family protein [Sulfuricurvum sp.]|uniref:cytochrome c family protein n=1 Tax=Sulfuricurvum sp. TaxID=2025608 RepID=UPI0025DAD269|nr:cytochrome c family protein [Sulfuricurvum sp.]MCK9372044.1 cytochrome c family protein [Sulfuricurvum sp.]
MNFRHLTAVFTVLCLCTADGWCSENARVMDELNSPLTPNPLKSAIGEALYNEAIASGEYRYTGNDKCRLCHRDFFIGRKHDQHDHSMDYISSGEFKNNPRCLVCHSTGYGTPSGFVLLEKTPRLSNVQCEGCHGPGSNHIKVASLKKTGGGLLAGEDNPERLKKMCKVCHTSRWNRSYNDFESAYSKYKKAVPK